MADPKGMTWMSSGAFPGRFFQVQQGTVLAHPHIDQRMSERQGHARRIAVDQNGVGHRLVLSQVPRSHTQFLPLEYRCRGLRMGGGVEYLMGLMGGCWFMLGGAFLVGQRHPAVWPGLPSTAPASPSAHVSLMHRSRMENLSAWWDLASRPLRSERGSGKIDTCLLGICPGQGIGLGGFRGVSGGLGERIGSQMAPSSTTCTRALRRQKVNGPRSVPSCPPAPTWPRWAAIRAGIRWPD